jgi:hypothetical protein
MTPAYDEPPYEGRPYDEPHHDAHGSSSPRAAALIAWSGERPWLGGAVTTLGGLAIAVLPNKGFTVVVLPGVAGLSGFVLGGLIIACGMFMLFSPQLHGFLGIATVLLSLVSFVTTNIGGYVIGLLLGIVGGSLGFAWNPPDPD